MANENEKELQEELQKLYLHQQMLRYHINTYTEQSSMVEAKIQEISSTIEAVEALGKAEKGSETLSNLGSDVYVPSELKETKKVVVNIGSGIYQKKTTEEALKLLNKKKEQLEEMNSQLSVELNKLNKQLHQIEPEMQKLAQKLQD